MGTLIWKMSTQDVLYEFKKGVLSYHTEDNGTKKLCLEVDADMNKTSNMEEFDVEMVSFLIMLSMEHINLKKSFSYWLEDAYDYRNDCHLSYFFSYDHEDFDKIKVSMVPLSEHDFYVEITGQTLDIIDYEQVPLSKVFVEGIFSFEK